MKELPSGLKYYEPKIKTILSWMPDWLHMDDFDTKAWSANDDDEPLSFLPITGDTDISMMLRGSFGGKQQEYMMLLLKMMHIGLVEKKQDGNVVHYRVTDAGREFLSQ
jgi:hypothetical protein